MKNYKSNINVSQGFTSLITIQLLIDTNCCIFIAEKIKPNLKYIVQDAAGWK